MLLKSTHLLGACLVLAAADALPTQAQSANNNVIMYIGDGFGLAPKTATRMALGQGRDGKRLPSEAGFQGLNLDKLKYNATVTTHSLNSWITDSAPGASVYACGKLGKQDNEVIALNAGSGAAIETILEAAKKQGYAVGIVSTARITHATPAAFASHIWFRDLEDYIAAQYIASTEDQYEAIYNSSPTAAFKYQANRDWVLPTPKVGVELDVVLGGGARHFLPRTRGIASPYETIKDASGNAIINPATGTAATLRGNRADDVDLVSYAVTERNYNYVNSRDALLAVGSNIAQYGVGGKKLLGLFNASHVNYEQDRQTSAAWEPSLADMTRIAIQVLQAKSNGKGFFLMVEAGRIDHLEHSNTGGISVVAGSGTTNQYVVDADKPAYVGGGDAGVTATPTTARTTNVYGSDYMIKEVLAFDYAVAEGRALLNTPASGRTLLLSTSDHECGGFAVTGLHDEANAANNGTKIRTYAGQITKSVAAEAGYATPNNLVRGDGGANGWFPDYVMTSFQGKDYPTPASATAKRIVVAYASNPMTNGNGVNQTGSVGNHTPQDVWVGADDNTGTHASQIGGHGLLDNTSLTPIMANFLSLNSFEQVLLNARPNSPEVLKATKVNLSPVPFEDQFKLSFETTAASVISVELFNEVGQKVRTVLKEQSFTKGSHSVSVDGAGLRGGLYVAAITINGAVVSKKTIKL
jgi:alkaline phosphatase